MSQIIQNALLALIGIISTGAMALSGWTLAEVHAQGKTDAQQAEAALSLKEGSVLLIQAMKDQEAKISENQIKLARIHEQMVTLRRDLSRLEERREP